MQADCGESGPFVNGPYGPFYRIVHIFCLPIPDHQGPAAAKTGALAFGPPRARPREPIHAGGCGGRPWQPTPGRNHRFLPTRATKCPPGILLNASCPFSLFSGPTGFLSSQERKWVGSPEKDRRRGTRGGPEKREGQAPPLR